MDRQELKSLRIEFEKLGNSHHAPGAQFSSRSDGFSEWRLTGSSHTWQLFRGLAGRAAAAIGAKGWESWLDEVSRRNGVTENYKGYEPDTGIEHFDSWMQNPAWLSVLTIDALLAEDDSPPADIEWSNEDAPSRWAKKFKMSLNTLKARIDEGKIRADKVSKRRWRVAVDDLPK